MKVSIAPRIFTCKLALTSLLFCLRGNGQAPPSPTLADSVLRLSDPSSRTLLSQPDGLAKATGKVGYLEIYCRHNDVKPWDLATLAISSGVIALGQLVDRAAKADPITNLVTTRIHVRVDKAIKGTTPRDIYVDIPGGGVEIGKLNFAEVHTDESLVMSNGDECVLFLNKKSEAGAFNLSNGAESVFPTVAF